MGAPADFGGPLQPGRLRLTAAGRRWVALLVAGSVALGIGAGYWLAPPLPAPVVMQPPRAADAVPAAPRAVAPPRRLAPLGTPFTLAHEGRLRTPAPPPPAPGRAGADPAPRPAAAPAALRLVGVMQTAQGSRAILWRGDHQIALAPGESSGGLTLLAVAEDSVMVRDAGGEWILYLPGAEGSG